MAGQEHPSEAPPSYAQATGSSSGPSHLQVPNAHNNIPPSHRRSMEDEGRPLPDGWVRLFDEQHEHQFFVNTRAEPPRSIWHHPYDDETFLSTLSSEERERIQEQSRKPTKQETAALDTDGSDTEEPHKHADQKTAKVSSPRPDASTAGSPSTPTDPQSQKKPLGRKLKDKITGSTHEQRVADREQRAREEAEQYRDYLAYRGALRRAYETGQPQLVGKNREGNEVYVEPPYGVRSYRDQRGVYINPYASGPYTNPNARFIRPQAPYARPYGSSYGGGYGLPLAGGIAGGLLLGGALGGFGL